MKEFFFGIVKNTENLKLLKNKLTRSYHEYYTKIKRN